MQGKGVLCTVTHVFSYLAKARSWARLLPVTPQKSASLSLYCLQIPHRSHTQYTEHICEVERLNGNALHTELDKLLKSSFPTKTSYHEAV